MDQHRNSACARRLAWAAPFGGAVLMAASAASAQTSGSTPSNFSRGYGFSAGELNNPVNVSNRDANGNLTIVNGVMQTGGNGGVFSNLFSVGAADGSSGTSTTTSTGGGAGYGSATAIGNNLSVVVDGQYNTVIVNATQTNNGAVSATTVLNGKVNLDGGQ